MKRWMQGPLSASGLLLLTFLTAASRSTDSQTAAPAPAPSLEEELKSFEAQLAAPSSAESLFTGGRNPDLVVVTSTDVHGEVEPCG